MVRRMKEWISHHPTAWHFVLYVTVLLLETANNWGHTTHVKREARRNVYRAANFATGGLLRKALG